MEKRDKRKHSYTLLLMASIVLAAIAWAFGFFREGTDGIAPGFIDPVSEVQAVADNRKPEAAGADALGSEDRTTDKGAAAGAGVSGSADGTAEKGAGADAGVSGSADGTAEKGAETGAGASGSADGAAEKGADAGALGSTDGTAEKETETGQDTGTDGEETENETAADEETAAETEEDVDEAPVMFEADTSYFDDALFIGDSRTVGLAEYGDLGNAEVVADSGMSVYKIFDKKFKTVSGEKKLLETVLSEGEFGKIYLMLGINELGYDYNYTITQYERLIGRIRELQPEALIFLEGNLHITAEKSGASPDFTNENIDRFNEAVSRMADDRTLFYLDVNELFDDGNGNLEKKYTTDDVHILAKYYEQWAEWILKHAR